jgi:hypothetical protein
VAEEQIQMPSIVNVFCKWLGLESEDQSNNQVAQQAMKTQLTLRMNRSTHEIPDLQSARSIHMSQLS